MAKYSILQVNPLDWEAEFDVDNTLLEVPILNTGPGSSVVVAGKAAGIVQQFIIGENTKIESVGIRIPHLFCMGTQEPTLFIRGQTATKNEIIYGPIEIPYFNAEIPIEIPLNFETFTQGVGGPETIELQLELVGAGTVSMLNVPDIINGETIAVLPFIKILHNFDLIP